MRRLALLLTLLLLPLTGCRSADPALNPHVTPRPPEVKVAPSLPKVTPPAGWISQQAAQEKALAVAQKNGAALTLSAMRVDAVNGLWEVDFQCDSPVATEPRSPPPQEHSSRDPVVRRREEWSWVSVAREVTVAVDGRTGEARGGGFTGGAATNRTDLEHYHGRIVSGGEWTTLRLINADGSREGRDVTVAMPRDVLTDRLRLWQLEYGTGRELDVWGLTGAGGTVVAYRLAMPHPPSERLPVVMLQHGVAFYPDAIWVSGDEAGHNVVQAKGASLAAVRKWYAHGFRVGASGQAGDLCRRRGAPALP